VVIDLNPETITLIVLLGNMIVNVFLAYLYRIRVKIETLQIEIMKKNAEALECLKEFRKYIRAEEKDILKMSPEELREFVEELKHLGE
jgi:hypothetical protein